MCQAFMAHLRSHTHHPPPAEIISYVNSITASEGESEDEDDGTITKLGNHQNLEGSSKKQTYELSIVPPDQHQKEQHLASQSVIFPMRVGNIFKGIYARLNTDRFDNIIFDKIILLRVKTQYIP
jgi:hypothetical protein